MSAHGLLLVALLTLVVTAVTWALVPNEIDRGILGWVLGLLTAACGVTWLLHV